MAVCIVLFWKLYTVLRKKEPTRQEIVNFSFKMFNMRFLRSWKCLKTTWNSPGQSVELTQNLATDTATPYSWHSYAVALQMIIIRSLMLWKSTSSFSLNVTVPIQFALHPCDPFFINNCNMIRNSVEKHCFVVLNLKLHVKLRCKTFYWLLKLLYTVFALNTTNNPACFARKFCIS